MLNYAHQKLSWVMYQMVVRRSTNVCIFLYLWKCYFIFRWKSSMNINVNIRWVNKSTSLFSLALALNEFLMFFFVWIRLVYVFAWTSRFSFCNKHIVLAFILTDGQTKYCWKRVKSGCVMTREKRAENRIRTNWWCNHKFFVFFCPYYCAGCIAGVLLATNIHYLKSWQAKLGTKIHLIKSKSNLIPQSICSVWKKEFASEKEHRPHAIGFDYVIH